MAEKSPANHYRAKQCETVTEQEVVNIQSNVFESTTIITDWRPRSWNWLFE